MNSASDTLRTVSVRKLDSHVFGHANIDLRVALSLFAMSGSQLPQKFVLGCSIMAISLVLDIW